MTLPSRHRTPNSSPGGVRPSTLPRGHESSPRYWIFMSERRRKIVFLLNLNATWTRDLRLSKLAALTIAPGPRHLQWYNIMGCLGHNCRKRWVKDTSLCISWNCRSNQVMSSDFVSKKLDNVYPFCYDGRWSAYLAWRCNIPVKVEVVRTCLWHYRQAPKLSLRAKLYQKHQLPWKIIAYMYVHNLYHFYEFRIWSLKHNFTWMNSWIR